MYVNVSACYINLSNEYNMYEDGVQLLNNQFAYKLSSYLNVLVYPSICICYVCFYVSQYARASMYVRLCICIFTCISPTRAQVSKVQNKGSRNLTLRHLLPHDEARKATSNGTKLTTCMTSPHL